MDMMIEYKNIHKYFGKLEVLKGVNLSIAEKEVVCVIGPSGSGKSTLLRCLNHLERITSGEIYVDGELVDKNEIHGHQMKISHQKMAEINSELGMVFQRFNLFPHMTVLENVISGPMIVKKEKKETIIPYA